MLNKEIPKEKLKGLELLVLDSDGVCVERGTDINERIENDRYILHIETNILSDRLAEKIKRLSKKLSIVICSGRKRTYLEIIYNKVIDEAFLIAENGAETFRMFNSIYSNLLEIKEEIIRKKLPIKGFEPKKYILTIHCDKEIKEIYDIVNSKDKSLKVMWNGEAFDIQQKEISKGLAVRFLFSSQKIIAIGDRINDKELLDIADVPVSADIKQLRASYWTTGNELPGEQLVDYLLKKL